MLQSDVVCRFRTSIAELSPRIAGGSLLNRLEPVGQKVADCINSVKRSTGRSFSGPPPLTALRIERMLKRACDKLLAVSSPAVLSKTKLTTILVFSLFSLLGQNSLTAQQPDTIRTIFETAKRGNWYVRVAVPREVIQGRVPFVYDESATVGSERIPFGAVTAVDRRQRNGSGAGTGALVGGLALAPLGWALAQLCESNCATATLGLATAGATVGATIGGLLGYAIDPGDVRWQRIWPAPGDVPDTVRAPTSDSPTRKGDSPYTMGTYAGVGFGSREELTGTRLAALGFVLARDYDKAELILLDLNLNRFDNVAALGVLAGANWFPSGILYLGAAGGVATAAGERTGMAELRAGVTNRARSSFRAELRTRAYRGVVDTVVWYVNLGYTVR